jgi:hypothetical protein
VYILKKTFQFSYKLCNPGTAQSDALTSIEALAASKKLKSILAGSKVADNINSLEPDVRPNADANTSSISFKKTSTNNNNLYQNQPFKCLADSIDPRVLLSIIQERLESHKKVDINASTMGSNSNPAGNPTNADNANESEQTTEASVANKRSLGIGDNLNKSQRVKCMPSARTINCQHHCVAILATRLFAVLCNEHSFQQKLISECQEVCFNLIVDILYPNNDPVIKLFLAFHSMGLTKKMDTFDMLWNDRLLEFRIRILKF